MQLGYGVDDPRNGDLGFLNPMGGVGQISYNDVAWWNAIWNVTDYFELALEVSHRRTRYLAPTADNEGTLFHFASTLTFWSIVTRSGGFVLGSCDCRKLE